MATIRIQKEAVPIIKSGLAIEAHLLKMCLDEYGKDLVIFEKKYINVKNGFYSKG